MKNKLITLISCWIPTLTWMGIIFYFSSRTRLGVSDQFIINFFFFKTLHIIEYCILFLLTLRSCIGSKRFGKKPYFVAFIISLIFALSDELHQSFVPTREASFRDVAIDSLGLFFGYVAYKKSGYVQKIVHAFT